MRTKRQITACRDRTSNHLITRYTSHLLHCLLVPLGLCLSKKTSHQQFPFFRSRRWRFRSFRCQRRLSISTQRYSSTNIKRRSNLQLWRRVFFFSLSRLGTNDIERKVGAPGSDRSFCWTRKQFRSISPIWQSIAAVVGIRLCISH